MSDSRRSTHTGDNEMPRTRNRSDSTPSSSSKRKSSKRSDPDRDGGFNPTSTSFSSTSQSPYPGIAAPSVASSYATANTTNPTNMPYNPPDLIRNESMEQRALPTSDTARESRKKRNSEGRQDKSSDSGNIKSNRQSKRSDKDERRRSSKREEKPRRTDSERALDNHRASMVENQFPGEFPSTFAEPYRPPGLAADYYGDQGESVAYQPGVRPGRPSIIIAADQAHLYEATIEAAPPPEPSSLGQVGAAASFYGGTSDFESDSPPKPSKNGNQPSIKPSRHSTGGASPRSSPGPEGRPVPYSATSSGPAAMAGTGMGAAPVIGQAAEYFSTHFNPDLTEAGSNAAASGYLASQGVQRPSQGMQNSTPGLIRPPPSAQRPSSGSNIPMYGAAAAGIAAAGAGVYYAGHHTTEEHHTMENIAAGSYGPQNAGQLPPTPQNYQSQTPMQQRRRRKGPFSKIVDFFQDPSGVAEYEAYTEAIGVCKYCFDPSSSPRDAPRKHHYNRRYSNGRYGSSTRVDKLNRYQSSDDEKRRRSNGQKWIATGLAGYGLAKMSEAAANRKNNFDDNYSIKSGRPEGSTRVSFAADERVPRSRRTKPSSDDQSYSRKDSRRDNETKIRKDKRTGELYEERSSRRRRDSSASDGFSKGAAISAGVAAAGLAAAAGRRNRSSSPKKRYYSKRVSPNHSFVDLSATSSGALGFGSFFSSPSANQRKGKKSKGLGLFTFTNASTSSSDADLAFGAGSVRRKRGKRDDHKSRDDGNVNAEILGLAATGVTLATEADRRDRKSKRRADLMVVKEPRNDRSGHHEKKRLQSPPFESDEENEDWIDASDDEASVDSALAYGGGLSARQSRESLASNDGTDKWSWRWSNGKKPRKKPSQDLSRFEPAAAGLVGAAAGAAVGAAAASSGRFGLTESTASLQSLQQLDPIPMTDASAFHGDRKISAISPMTEIPPRIFSANANSAPLEHPQPFAPISQAIYSSQAPAPGPMYSPSGPPVFSQYPPHREQAPMTESPKQLPMGFETQRQHSEDKRRRRRNSSPTPSQIQDDEFANKSRRRASTRDSVKFDLTEEQTEKDRRAQAREQRRSKREDRNEEKQADAANFQQEANLEREMDEISSRRRSSTDARTARELEIERELERLYEEDRRQKEARKLKHADTWPAAAAIGAGVAGIAAMAAAQSTSAHDESKVDPEERQSRRKSALKQTPTSTAVDDNQSDSQQRRIARMAAARVKSTASPVHDDYASYFIPPELAESVKEHNFVAEQGNNLTKEPAQIVEVAPRTARRKDTFDPFVYRPFGIEPEDDPRRYPWPVPLLDIIEPTPPVSVRGDMSPLPSKTPEPVEAPEVAPEEKQKRSSSVTWGEHRTHEYEVITPLEDHEEFVRTATYESSQPAIDLAETMHSDVKPELTEPVTVSVRTNGVPRISSEKDLPSPGPNVEEPQPKANYGQDLEFAAVLAAAAEGAGFDPSIVVNDPTYHRRDSPPGSEGASFYRSPYAETLSDLGTFHDYSLPQQRGFVEGEIPPTPANEVSKKGPEPGHTKEPRSAAEDEQIGVEPKIPGGFNVFDYLDDSTADATNSVNIKATENAVAIRLGKEDEERSKDKNRSSEMYAPAIESVMSQPIESEPSKKLTRSSTMDEASFEASLDEWGLQVSYASDPEGFSEKKRSKKKSSKKSDRATDAVIVGAAATSVPAIDELVDSERHRRRLEREDDTYYENVPPVSASELGADASVESKKSRRKSKRESNIWDDTKSVGSSPAEFRDDRESGKKSKKNSKRDSDIFDDDTISVSSLPADLNGDKASRKSKDKKSGGFFGLFSSTKSETSTSQKRPSREKDRQSRNGRDTKSEDLDEPKRKSKRKPKDKDLDDLSSDLQRSRSDSQPLVKNDVRQHSPEDEFVSSEEAVRDDEQTKDGVTFLGERPEMPTVLDGASGSIPKPQLEAEQGASSSQLPTVLHDPAISTVRSRSVSPHTIPANIDEHDTTHDEATSPSVQRDQFRQRHLAEIRTNDVFSSPLATSSPTAVPLHFRRLPVSPSFARSASIGSTSVASPISPLVTPHTRQARPTSTEFRNSKEFRPLYLVERHSSTKQPEPEVEETYPSLPSSRTSSAHPSMENLRGDDRGESFAEQYINPSQMHDKRHSFSYWYDQRPASPDYLDSRTATPTATEFPKEFAREKPKYEFHSPSELLEDPSRQLAESQEHESPPLSPMVLPSVGSPASSVAKAESGPLSSRPSSPVRDQQSADHEVLETGIGLGLRGSVATAFVASQLVEHEQAAVETTKEPLFTKDSPQNVPTLSAPFATPLDENAMPIDLPTSREIELSSKPQAADNEFALQPVSSKKAKKDKKKKRKTLDLADESVEASSSSLDAREESENLESLDASSATEPLPAPEVSIRDSPSDSIAMGSIMPRQPGLDILDGHDPASTKGAETESHDTLAASRVNKQAVPESKIGSGSRDFVEVQKDNTIPDEVPLRNLARKDELTLSTENLKADKKTDSVQKESTSGSQTSEPAVVSTPLEDTISSSQDESTDKSLLTADQDLTTSNIPALPEEKINTQMPSSRESMAEIPSQFVLQDRNLTFDSTLRALDDTNRTEGLNERSSRDLHPLDEPIAAPAVENATSSRPSALEEAFAKAEAARGTAPEVSEEEAFEAFQPHASLERSVGHGRLDTIVEGPREGSKVDLGQVEEAIENLCEDQDMSSGSKSKKEKKKPKKSKQSRELEAVDLDPEPPTPDEVKGTTQELTESTKDQDASLEPKESIPISDPSINPFGDDYVLPQEDNIDHKLVGTSHEQDSADAMKPEGASAAATPLGSPVRTDSTPRNLDESIEEFLWTSTSKKDKKKGKKGRASALISNASTPVTEMSSTESVNQPEVRKLDAGPAAVSTKKSKKTKKKSQGLDWTVEDAGAKQEVLQQAEEPLEKVTEMEQDQASQQKADEFSAPGGKKTKKNKKNNQGFNWTDEAATSLTEESIDTTIESQRDAPTAEAETEDLTWANTKKTKKDKKKGKKLALPNETPLEVDVVPGVEPISMPTTVEDQLPAADSEPRVLVPEMLAEAGLLRDDASKPGAPDEVSEPRDEVSIPRDVPSMPGDEAAIPQEEAILHQHDQHSSAPAEVSPVIAHGPPEQNVTEPAEASQSSAPELREKRAPELIEASQPPAPEVHEQKVPETVTAEESSKLQDSHGFPDSREVPQHTQKLVEASTLPSRSSDDREASIFGDLREVPEPTKASQQIPEVAEDHQASILRDSRWASVFGELRQRKARESSELQPQVSEVSEAHQASKPRDPGWALVLGELKQRKVSQPVRTVDQMVPAPDIEQEREVSVPSGAAQNIDILEKTETAVSTDSIPHHEEIHPEEQELSLEQTSQGQVKASADTLQTTEQPQRAAIEEPASHVVSPPVAVAQDIHEETQRAAQEAGTEISSRPEPTQQEEILRDNREVSNLRSESEFHQAAQPKTTTQLERRDEAETPAGPSQAPTPLAEEQVDEFSSAPAKRGKKEKKKSKSKQSVFDELAEPSSDSGRSKDIMPVSVGAGAAVETENEITPIATPAEPIAQADAFSLGQTKKIKKGKKKKNLAFAEETPTPASDDLDEGRSSIPWPASLAHLANDTTTEQLISEEMQVAKEINAEDEIQTQIEKMSTLPKGVEDPSLISTMPEKQQAVLPERKPVQEYTEREMIQTTEDKVLVAEPDIISKEPDDYSWTVTPKKKGKKDKKKRGSILDTSGSATPQTEDEPTLAEDTGDATSKAEPAEKDEWALSNKKSKKDEKKKKTAFSSLDDSAEPKVEEELQPVPDMSKGVETKIDRDIVEGTQVAVLAAPLTKEEPEEQAIGANRAEIVEAAKPKEDVQPTQNINQSGGPEIDPTTFERFTADILATPIVEQGLGERAIAHSAPKLAKAVDGGSATEREPGFTVSESEAIADHVEKPPIATNKSVAAEESILEHKPTAPVEDEPSWAPLPKESMADEKDMKNPKSTVVLEESLEESTSLANTIDLGKSATVHHKDYPVLTESSPTREPDRAADVQIVTETTTVEPESSAKQDMSLQTEGTEEHQQPDLPKPEATGDEEPLAFTTKKGKKEKKTKRKSAIDAEEPTVETIGGTAAATVAAVAAAATADHMQRDTEQLPAEDRALGEVGEYEKAPLSSSEPPKPQVSTQDVEPVAEPEEDTWGFSTKKTKRDKKKRRQSTFDEYNSTPSVSATPSEPFQVDKDIAISVNEPAPTLTSKEHETLKVEGAALTAATASIEPVEEDNFATVDKKKSKKDKKKKKTLLSWGEENDTSTDQPTETSMPANEPATNTSGEQAATFMESTDEPTTIPDVNSVDIGSSQVLEPTALLESSLPGTQQHLNTSEEPVGDLTYPDAQDLASGGNAVEVEEDGQWASSTARKSKKTKKGKKSKVESTFLPLEGGGQEFNSQEEAHSRSLSIPGAFEDVTESGSQSLQVSATKEDQQESLVVEEPKMTTEAVFEHAVTEDDPRHPGPSENVGLGIGTFISQATTAQAMGDQNLANNDEPLIQHEAQHYAVRDQAIRTDEKQHERALVDSSHRQEMPPIVDGPQSTLLQSTWSFTNLKDDTTQEHANRDSGIQVSDSPLVQAGHLHPTLRDSGYVPSPIAAASREISAEEMNALNALSRPPRPISPTSSSEDLRQKFQDRSIESHQSEITGETDDPALLPSDLRGFHHDQPEVLGKGHPSPVDSTTKDRSSALFNSSPSNRTEAYGASPRLDTRHMQAPVTDLHRSPSIHGHRSHDDLRSLTPSRSPTRQARQNSDAPIADLMQEVSQTPHRSIFGPFPTGDERDHGLSPPRTPLQTIHEHVPDTSPSNRRRRPLSDAGSPDRGHKSVHNSNALVFGEMDSRFEGEHPSDAFRTQIPPGQPSAVESEQESPDARTGNQSRGLAQVGGVVLAGAAAVAAAEEPRPMSRDDKPVDTKSLGKSKSRSTSSKQLRRSQASLENIASSSTHDPVREKGKAAARDMADVYNGYGESPGAPMSPTRPPSVRSRRSMQQLKDLEARLDQLVSENRLLATAKINAEQQLQDLHFAQNRTEHASQEALELRDAELREKDEAIAKMRETLDLMQKEVARLTEVNEGLTATHEQRYSELEEQHAETHEQWQESSRELKDLRSKHAELSTGMEEIVRHELDTRLAEKDAEIKRLYDELEDAKAKIRELQQQILVGQGDEIITARDEDYFDNACQQLCQHVQQWVLRFSKFSDTRVCRLTNEVRDEKVVDRFDNAILDGSDVDHYLGDRVKRRDVFMSVVMTMIWDYIFTRYLFGMDREQRQKLKLLEKNLSEVGPPSAVHRWRAMTLTLLSKRESFKVQRASDTEAVVEEIYSTLARFLPPPQHLQGQIQESLRNVMKAAVDLSIEMRTQRAEYIMLPPLQPEYDTNGDLARKVYFNAALMNERSGETTSNDELEAQQAVVRMVLFPLVVKKGSDTGEGDEEIVVCPAQVLVARSGKDKKVVKAVSGDRMSIDQRNRSVQSFAPSILDPTNVI